MKHLTIADLESGDRREPIFVLNTAPDSDIGQTGEILLSIPKRNGTGVDPLMIYQTWLPQEVTAQIPRMQILASTQFRGAMNSKLIAVISKKDADRLLAQDGADSEQARLLETRRHVRAAGAARTIADSGAEIHRADGVKDTDDSEDSNNKRNISIGGDDDNVSKQAKAGVADVEPGISAKYQMWVQKLNNGSDVQAMNELKSRRAFSKNELSYLARSLNAGFSKTMALVRKSLAQHKM